MGVATFKFKMGNVVEDNPLLLEHNTEDAAKDHQHHEASLKVEFLLKMILPVTKLQH